MLFIAVGNRYRRDDGAALALADRLRAQPVAGLDIIEASDDMIRLVQIWSDHDFVIVADAVDAGEEPGTLYRRDPIASPLPRHWFGVSTHHLGIADTIELGRAMNRLPRQILFIGIQGGDFGEGEGLTPEVARSIEVAAEIVEAAVRSCPLK